MCDGLGLTLGVDIEVPRVDGGAEGIQRGELVADTGLCQFGSEPRLVALDGEAQDMVFVCGDAGFAEQEVVRQQQREDGCQLWPGRLSAALPDGGRQKGWCAVHAERGACIV